MNLNPLKKEDNTDALVKALEDASGNDQSAMSQPASDQPPVAAPNPAGPTVSSTPTDPIQQSNTPITTIADPAAPAGTDSTIPQDDTAVSTDTPLSFSNNLPEGLSNDADAHLPSDGSNGNDGIDGVKKSALEQLRPLIEKLDLEPSDKFDKYLMMLRASDDPVLIKPAFDAAQAISGEKERAQALLDIINEINYITANQQDSAN